MKPLFYGWIVTGCAFVVLFLTYGVQYSFGIFVPVMVDELGWQRASLGGAFSFYTVVYTTFSLLSGKLTDSLGPRRVVGLGGVLLGVGIMATSQMSSQWQLFFWYGIVAALGMSTAYIPCNVTVVRWFQRKRGLALGVASCGASCGILAVPVFTSLLINLTDWRTTMLTLGAGMLVLISVVARFMVSDPKRMGLLPDGAGAPAQDAIVGSLDDTTGWTLREAAATLSFWVFLVAFAVGMLTTTIPFVHIAGFAQDIGLSDIAGAMTFSIMGLFALIGSVSLGTVSDRIGRKAMMVFALASQVLAYVLFLNAESVTTLYLGAAAFGFFYGGIATLFPALVGDLFGPAHAGTIGGSIFAGGGILGAWGPALAGYLRDVHGDYHLAFFYCVLIAACALVLFALLPKPHGS